MGFRNTQENLENYLDFCKFGTPQSGLDFVPKLPPLPSFSNHEIANSSLDTIECQLKIRKIICVIKGPFFFPRDSYFSFGSTHIFPFRSAKGKNA